MKRIYIPVQSNCFRIFKLGEANCKQGRREAHWDLEVHDSESLESTQMFSFQFLLFLNQCSNFYIRDLASL